MILRDISIEKEERERETQKEGKEE